ncbi:MAG: hypothetical protein HKN33_19020 [Pyrinomonadaceae bacterium]|nr:hypothetical protein [Pyrinomonadaceae bacterium]
MPFKVNTIISTLLFRTLSGVALLLVAIVFTGQFAHAQNSSSDDSLFRIEFEKERLLRPCGPGCAPREASNECSDAPNLKTALKLIPNQPSFEMDDVWFEYLPDHGEILEVEAKATWSLWRQPVGMYWLKVKINRGFETLDVVSKSLEISECDCDCVVDCAGITVEAKYPEVQKDDVAVFRIVQREIFSSSDKIEWAVENGEIVSGSGRRILKVRATGPPGSQLRVMAVLTKDAAECRSESELTLPIIERIEK